MQTREVKTAEDARALIEQRGLTHVKLGLSDIDGVLRGKYLSRDKFFSALEGGFGFCDVVMGWDSSDQLYDNTRFTGWHTAYPDVLARILPATCRDLPLEPATTGDDSGTMLFFLAELSGRGEAVCPRNLLKRVLAKIDAAGYVASAALEYEFFLFDETPHSVREKGYRNLKNWTPGYFGYSVLRSTVASDFHQDFLDCMEVMDIPIEGFHTETGPGVLEAALTVDEALSAGDKGLMFKTFTKVFAQQRGLMATFMAKWNQDLPGSSGHIHVSLKGKNGEAAFHDPKQPHNMSKLQSQFLAGVQKYLPEFMVMYAQNVNSYSRMVPGYWAPLNATWGMENRTTAIRLIPGSPKAQRIEVRIGSADANPYLALAAALASGYLGMQEELEPEPMVEGNAYQQKFPERLHLPNTLWDAAQRLKQSAAARAMFGDEFVEHFAATREWEERQFRRHVTDWELARYFEII